MSLTRLLTTLSRVRTAFGLDPICAGEEDHLREHPDALRAAVERLALRVFVEPNAVKHADYVTLQRAVSMLARGQRFGA